ncbi:MAG: hypothetical protein R6V44_15020 [Paracoccaceae bacterium]
MKVAAAAALVLSMSLPGVASDENIELPPDVVEGFYVTLDDIRARSDEVYDALAGVAGDPISRSDFVGRNLPEHIVPEQTDRELLEKLFGLLDVDGDGQLTREEWNERIVTDLSSADANDDGKITLGELSRARENLSIGDALGMIF